MDLDVGSDLVIINRSGKRERDGQGLGYLIGRTLEAHTPVVIAVSSQRLAEWIKFTGDTTVKLACDRHSLAAWRCNISVQVPDA